MGHQLIDGIDFKDEVNNCYATLKFGTDSYKEQDWLTGEIVKNGKTVCRISGNYMGFIDFDGERYWDAREIDHWCTPLEDWEIDCLPSDSSRRRDVTTLKIKSADEAQVEKEYIE